MTSPLLKGNLLEYEVVTTFRIKELHAEPATGSLRFTDTSRFRMYKLMLCWLAVAWLKFCDASTVHINCGDIEGNLVEYEDIHYFSYQGIPYAEPPTGSLRFMPPVPKKSWTGVLNASSQRYVCPQPEKDYKKEQMNEDCLFLNVYVPANFTKGELLPVLIYAPGGEFKSLSGYADALYGPQLFMKNGVIVVTFNYRLGALGFLSLGTPEASGNAGIKDAILALQWVNENIEYFGGDNKNITVGGNSAGAVLVHYLTLSSKTNGLFQRVFLDSGSALGYRFLARHPVENAKTLAKRIGIESQCKDTILTKLKELDAFSIVEAETHMGKGNARNGLRPFAPFVPCVEEESDHAVITNIPINTIKCGLTQNVPILAGFNAQEGIKMLPAVLKNRTLIDVINDNFELSIPTDLEYPLGSEESKNLAQSIKQFYFSGGDITDLNIDTFVDMITDTQFYHSIDYWITIHSQNSNSKPVFYYKFDYDGGLNWFKLKNELNFPGTSHADELGYIFVTNITKPLRPNANAADKEVEQNFLMLWTNFIKYGTPTLAGSKVRWPESGEERNYLLLNDQLTVQNGPPLPNRSEFWAEIYDDYYDYVQNGGYTERKIIP